MLKKKLKSFKENKYIIPSLKFNINQILKNPGVS